MIPYGVLSLHFDHSIFQPDIFQFNIFFKKEPVGNPDSYFTGIKQCIFLPVFNQYTLQMHIVEQGKINMLYFNFGMQVFGKAVGYFLDDPVLTKRSLNKNPQCYDEE